jgi:hypothetical protein
MKNRLFILALIVLSISCKKEPQRISPADDLGPKILKVITTYDESDPSINISKIGEYSGDSLNRINFLEWDVYYDLVYLTKDELNIRAFRSDSIYGPQPMNAYFDGNIIKSGSLMARIDLAEIESCCGAPVFSNQLLSYKEGKLDTTSIIYQGDTYFESCKDMVYDEGRLVSFKRVQRASDQAFIITISYGNVENGSVVNTNPYNNFILSLYSYLFMEEGYMSLARGVSDYFLFQRELSITGVKSDRLISGISIQESWNPDEVLLNFEFKYERDAIGRVKQLEVFRNGELARVEEFYY